VAAEEAAVRLFDEEVVAVGTAVAPETPVTTLRRGNARLAIDLVSEMLGKDLPRMGLEQDIDGGHLVQQPVLVKAHFPAGLSRGDTNMVEELNGSALGRDENKGGVAAA